MDRSIVCVFIMALWVCVWTKEPVRLYTDLIKVIANDGNCSVVKRTTDASSEDSILDATQSIILTRFSFSNIFLTNRNEQICKPNDISQTNFRRNTWACFSTGIGSTTLRDTNWVFLDCEAARFVSVKCLTKDAIAEIMDTACRGDSSTNRCVTFSTATDEKHYMCSKNFAVKREENEKEDKQLSFVSPFDIAAYFCAAFILICFMLALCIPAEKCKPSYNYDKDLERRIPLEIYEMYGASYMPSAKRQLTENAEKWKRKLSRLRPHSRNLAIEANLLEDAEPYSNDELKTRKDSHGAKRVVISSDVVRDDGHVEKLNDIKVDDISEQKETDIHNEKLPKDLKRTSKPNNETGDVKRFKRQQTICTGQYRESEFEHLKNTNGRKVQRSSSIC